jgi:hypothetical protein
LSFRYSSVGSSLNRAGFRWQWLRLLRGSLVLGSVLCLWLLLLGLAILGGWVQSRASASAWVVIGCAVAFVAWVAVIIGAMVRGADAGVLAKSIERVNPGLLDRLNTLVFFERSRASDSTSEGFAARIARQCQSVLTSHSVKPAFPMLGLRRYWLVFMLALMGTVAFYRLCSPWQQLIATRNMGGTGQQEQSAPELTLPPTNNIEQNPNWGEVRITAPGSDLHVTKVDVVPMQIEAAANRALQSVTWASAINGGTEAAHSLPPPSEPRFAVYQPVLYLDELQLSDWDVVTYYAKASTEGQGGYGSEVYFIEVRPFREDILKMPGGEGGKPYESLNEISTLISRQQQVIRQTHQHLQSPPEQAALQEQDRRKLSDAEKDVDDSTRHLYAKMAAEMENKPIGEALDNLSKAGHSLDKATGLLQSNAVAEAQWPERAALSELVAARKMFQKAVSDHAGDFADSDSKPEESTPVAENSRKLNEMAEFRDEARAAREFVRKTSEAQTNLNSQIKGGRRDSLSALGRQEVQLEKSLSDFQEQHPQVFRDVKEATRATHAAMAKAAESMEKRSSDAGSAAREASEQLEKLGQTMDERDAQQQVSNAYRLKQMLDKQANTFDQNARQPDSVPNDTLNQTARQARQTADQLRRTAEQDSGRQAFGQSLRDVLSGQSRSNLDGALQRVQQAASTAERQQASGQARDELARVSKAFSSSQPKSLQSAQEKDASGTAGEDSFKQGMTELESLLKELEKGRPPSEENQGKQGRQALYDLQAGMRGRDGDPRQSDQILKRLDQMLKAKTPLEAEGLKKLLDELQRFSVETSDALEKRNETNRVANIDPARLPPTYRGRIQKYFQRLSER